jgi:P pilus assembly chaperone PapD
VKKLLATALMAMSFTAAAIPQISVGQMYEFIDGDKSTLLKRIMNNGDNTAFIKTEVSEITWNANGQKNEKRFDASAISNASVDGLIVTPARMIVPAKNMQPARFIVTGSRDKERYYRVRFIPVMPKDQYEFGQTKKDFDDYSKKLNAGVNVLTGFGTIAVVRPKNATFNTTIQSEGNSITIRNNGNSTIVLDNIKQCAGNNCSESASTILLPGKQHQLRKEVKKSWQFTLLEGRKKTPKTFG